MSIDGLLTKGGVFLVDYNKTGYFTYALAWLDWGEEYATSMTCFYANSVHQAIYAGKWDLSDYTSDSTCSLPG